MRFVLRNNWVVAGGCLSVAIGLFLVGMWFPNLNNQENFAGTLKPKHRKILRVKIDRHAYEEVVSRHLNQAPSAIVSPPVLSPAPLASGSFPPGSSGDRVITPPFCLAPLPARAPPLHV